MNTIKLTQTRIGFLIIWLREQVVQFIVARSMQYESPSRSLAAAPSRAEGTAHEAHAERLFRQAVYENSNLEFDWLWYATNMTRVTQKRYCLLRALVINPDSEVAKRTLATLPKEAPDEAVVLTAPTSM